jgi:DNA repair protein RecO (recombination protein O)
MKEVEGYLVALFPTKNNDAMMRVLTKDGIIAFFARGVMNYKHDAIATTSLFNYSKFFLFEGQQKGLSLRQGQLLYPVKLINESLLEYATLELMSEIINHILVDYEPQLIYEYLSSSLQALSKGTSGLIIANLFLAKTLTLIGLQPTIDECVICRSKTSITTIDFDEGGFICQSCFNNNKMKKYDKKVLLGIRLLFEAMKKNVFTISIDDKESLIIMNLFNQHIHNHLNRQLKSISVLIKACE